MSRFYTEIEKSLKQGTKSAKSEMPNVPAWVKVAAIWAVEVAGAIVVAKAMYFTFFLEYLGRDFDAYALSGVIGAALVFTFDQFLERAHFFFNEEMKADGKLVAWLVLGVLLVFLDFKIGNATMESKRAEANQKALTARLEGLDTDALYASNLETSRLMGSRLAELDAQEKAYLADPENSGLSHSRIIRERAQILKAKQKADSSATVRITTVRAQIVSAHNAESNAGFGSVAYPSLPIIVALFAIAYHKFHVRLGLGLVRAPIMEVQDVSKFQNVEAFKRYVEPEEQEPESPQDRLAGLSARERSVLEYFTANPTATIAQAVADEVGATGTVHRVKNQLIEKGFLSA